MTLLKEERQLFYNLSLLMFWAINCYVYRYMYAYIWCTGIYRSKKYTQDVKVLRQALNFYRTKKMKPGGRDFSIKVAFAA